MARTTRRDFLRGAAALGGGLLASRWCRGAEVLVRSTKKSDVRLERISCSFEEHLFRVPLGFAQATVNRQTILTVNCAVRTADGRTAEGFGILPLNYVFT